MKGYLKYLIATIMIPLIYISVIVYMNMSMEKKEHANDDKKEYVKVINNYLAETKIKLKTIRFEYPLNNNEATVISFGVLKEYMVFDTTLSSYGGSFLKDCSFIIIVNEGTSEVPEYNYYVSAMDVGGYSIGKNGKSTINSFSELNENLVINIDENYCVKYEDIENKLNVKITHSYLESNKNNNSQKESNINVNTDENIIKDNLNKKLESNSTAKELYDIVNKIDNCTVEGWSEIYKKDISLVSEYRNEISEIVMKIIGEPNTYKEINGTKFDAWTKEKVESAWKKVFGNTSEPFKDDQVHGVWCNTWNSDGTIHQGGCGGTCGLYSSTITDFDVKDDTISFYASVIFNDENNNDTNSESNYKYVFKKDSEGNYYFYSIEKLKK